MINGTASNETLVATDTTLTPGDTINLGAGSDTLNFYQTTTLTAAASVGAGLTISGVETLNVTDTAAGAYALTVDTSVFGGLTTASVTNTGAGTVTLDKLSKTVVAGLTGQQSGAETFSYNGVAATDTIKLALTGVYGTSSTTNATLNLGKGTGAATTDVAPTLLSLSGTGGRVTLIDDSITTITSTTTGTSTLALDGSSTTTKPTIRTIDFSASAATNTIDLATGGGTAAANTGVGFSSAGFTFKGGSGKDTLSMTLSEAGNYASTWSVDGGASTDTLALYSPLAATSSTAYGAAQTLTATQISFINKLANFETLQLIDRDTGTLATGNNAAGWSVAVDGITSVTDFSFSSSFKTTATSGYNAIVGNQAEDATSVAAAPAITITGQANVDTFTFAGRITGGLGATTGTTLTSAPTPAAALSVTPLLDNGANTLNITLSAATITGGAAAKATVGGANAFTATSFETLNITSGGTGTNVTIAAGGSYTNTLAGGAGATTGAAGYSLALGTNTTINVSGARNIDLGTVSGTNETINASTLTGDLKFVEGGTASNITVTGGTGANDITVLTGVNTIDISGSTANKDSIRISGNNGPTLSSTLSTASVTQIKGFTNVATNGDLLDITDTTLQSNATATSVTATAGTFSTGVSFTASSSNGILTLTATGTAKFNDYMVAAESYISSGSVAAFEYNGNTFVVDHTGTSTYQVVELVGVTGVTSLSATASGATAILIG